LLKTELFLKMLPQGRISFNILLEKNNYHAHICFKNDTDLTFLLDFTNYNYKIVTNIVCVCA